MSEIDDVIASAEAQLEQVSAEPRKPTDPIKSDAWFWHVEYADRQEGEDGHVFEEFTIVDHRPEEQRDEPSAIRDQEGVLHPAEGVELYDHGWGEVELSRPIAVVALIPLVEGLPIQQVKLLGDAKPFLTRRTHLHGVLQGETWTERICIVGSRQPCPDGTMVETYLFLWEDGRVLLSNDINAA